MIDGNEQGMLAYFRRVAAGQRSARSTAAWAWIDAKGISRVSSACHARRKPVDASGRVVLQGRSARRNKPYVSAGIVSRRNDLRVVVVAVPTHDAAGAINGVLAGALKVKPAADRARARSLSATAAS